MTRGLKEFVRGFLGGGFKTVKADANREYLCRCGRRWIQVAAIISSKPCACPGSHSKLVAYHVSFVAECREPEECFDGLNRDERRGD